jgi:hypothetical protein
MELLLTLCLVAMIPGLLTYLVPVERPPRQPAKR